MKLKGIDVSHHNGEVDWEKVKNAGMDFAYIRMGYSGYEGEIHLDRLFYKNIREAKNAGLKVGAYIYSYNRGKASAGKTADEAAGILKGIETDLPLAFDVEETGHDIFVSRGKEENSLVCIEFFKALREKNLDGILYTYTNFAKNYLNMEMLSQYDLWIADYRDETGEKCPYEGKFEIWQYMGSKGRCDGVKGPCDLNFCYKDYEDNTDYKRKYEELKKAVCELIKKYEKITAS